MVTVAGSWEVATAETRDGLERAVSRETRT